MPVLSIKTYRSGDFKELANLYPASKNLVHRNEITLLYYYLLVFRPP